MNATMSFSLHVYAFASNKTYFVFNINFIRYREFRNLSENELTRNSSGNTWSQSSQLDKPLWTYPGLTGGISWRELISTKKKKKKSQTGNKKSSILPESSHARKKPPPPPPPP